MSLIIQKTREIYRKYGQDDLDFVAWKLGAMVYEVLEAENIKEVYFPKLKAIALQPNLHPHKRSYLIAHALGITLFKTLLKSSRFQKS